MSERRYAAPASTGRSEPGICHVLLHTAITAVARLAGYPVAHAFAGYTPPSVTGRYLHAGLAAMTRPTRWQRQPRHK